MYELFTRKLDALFALRKLIIAMFDIDNLNFVYNEYKALGDEYISRYL